MTQFTTTNIESSVEVQDIVGMDDRYFDSNKYKILVLSDNSARNGAGKNLQDINFDAQFQEGQQPDFTQLVIDTEAYLVFEVSTIEEIALAEDSIFTTEIFSLVNVNPDSEEPA